MNANGYDHAAEHSHHERIMRENEDLRRDAQENTRTILFLARLLGKTLGERDRARDTAVTMEQELALLRIDDHYGPKGRGDD